MRIDDGHQTHGCTFALEFAINARVIAPERSDADDRHVDTIICQASVNAPEFARVLKARCERERAVFRVINPGSPLLLCCPAATACLQLFGLLPGVVHTVDDRERR